MTTCHVVPFKKYVRTKNYHRQCCEQFKLWPRRMEFMGVYLCSQYQIEYLELTNGSQERHHGITTAIGKYTRVAWYEIRINLPSNSIMKITNHARETQSTHSWKAGDIQESSKVEPKHTVHCLSQRRDCHRPDSQTRVWPPDSQKDRHAVGCVCTRCIDIIYRYVVIISAVFLYQTPWPLYIPYFC